MTLRARLSKLEGRAGPAPAIWYGEGEDMVESGTGRRVGRREWEAGIGAGTTPFTLAVGERAATAARAAPDRGRGDDADDEGDRSWTAI